MELRRMECRWFILADFMLAQLSSALSESSRSLVYSFSVSGGLYGALEELVEEGFAVRAELAGVLGGVSDFFEHELEFVQELVFVLACH